MPFLINCDNKGCMQQQAARLDLNSGDVICVECSKSINNITSFAKAQLKSFGQTTKKAKTQQTYSVKCSHCSIDGVPRLADDKLNCASCSKELTQLSYPFAAMLKSVLVNESKKIQQDS